jgi:sterol desaturase/sphingolipid hydroxylase (fatty acid hydroxylase superfamily)
MLIRKSPPRSVGGFFATAFQKDIYWSRSAITDYSAYAGLMLFAAFFPWGVFNWLQAQFSHGVSAALSLSLGNHFLTPSLTAKVLFVAISFLLMDLAWFATHYAFHKIPVLWEFHAVHHSAEKLNVITAYRVNPVETLSTFLCIAVFLGLFAGLYRYLFGPQSALVMAAIPTLLYVPFEAYNLFKHHHIPMSFGPVISRFVASPHLHHVHHSTAPEHIDRNFGHFLSIWDWMFGTLVFPIIKEKMDYGLTYGIEDRPIADYRSIVDCFVKPFWRAARLLVPGGAKQDPATIGALSPDTGD